MVRKTISMNADDVETVNRIAEMYGFDFSTAIRFILREWAMEKNETVPAVDAQTPQE